MELIDAYKGMATAHGWNGAAGHLGMSKAALEARVYEQKGQGMRVDTALILQEFSGTKLFAQAIASQSGGVFVQIPQGDDVDNESLLLKFNELHADLGDLSREFTVATANGEINKTEKKKLDLIREHIEEHLHQLLALSYKIYCRPAKDDK